MDSPVRRPTSAVPLPSPDSGLAEWTSRIKALQRAVDADEEAEQRLLEEEIRQSRLARSRRSGGTAGLSAGERERLRAASPALQRAGDKQAHHADALRKLAGDASADAVVDTQPLPKPSVTRALPPSSTSSNTNNGHSEPVSLAAFIGGRATGPRLNRPAAQPDTHDPTLFEQRSRADIAAPHPIFGRGGVALAGLANKGRDVILTQPQEASTADEEPEKANREAAVVQVASPPVTTPTPAAKNWARERTFSTPSPAVPTTPKSIDRPPNAVGQGVRSRVDSLYANANRSTERVTTPSGLRGTKSIEKLKPAAPAKPDSLRRPIVTTESPTRPSPAPAPSSSSSTNTPQKAQTSSPFKSTGSPSSISTPSLARPVQPQVRPLSTGPQLPSSRSPAPAFLKPPQQKDLTPSLSRLQGRGFVQSFVRQNSEREASTTAATTPERLTPGMTGVSLAAPSPSPKRSSVLDRWNPQSPSPTPSPVSPAPPLRKARTMDGMQSGRPEPPVSSSPSPVADIKRPAPPVKAKSVVDVPITKGEALGSSNTLISFIKPTKTGDAPPTDALEAHQHRPKTPSRSAAEGYQSLAGADELGMRMRTKSESGVRPAVEPRPSTSGTRTPGRESSSLALEASGRPLSHPTKDRARMRRKGATAVSGGANAVPVDSEPENRAEAVNEGHDEPSLQTTPFPEANTAVVPSSLGQQSQQTSVSVSQARGENIRKLHESWANQAPIAVKPIRKASSVADSNASTNFNAAPSYVKHALPGLANNNNNDKAPVVSPPSPPPTPPLVIRTESSTPSRPPQSPRHSRIPSTGSRPTVMDVAQAFSAAAAANTNSSASPMVSSPRSPPPMQRPQASQEPQMRAYDLERDPGGWGEPETNERTITPAIMKAERRRSTYEKYANFVLPVLKEEKTPAPSPVQTLKEKDIVGSAATAVGTAEEEELGTEKSVEELVAATESNAEGNSAKVHIDIVDEAIPSVNVSAIWSKKQPAHSPEADMHTVSVEVLSIDSGTASEVARGVGGFHIFYDAEILAVVHRAKSRASGLVISRVWAWKGRNSTPGELDMKKLGDLAKRYGTELTECGQYCEPQELVHVLGGTLVIRQGKRSLWSAENTTMHRARSWAGLLLIDEVDMNVRNLCSGFSYCISLLDTLWVWYGCGSSIAERNIALRYAQALQEEATGTGSEKSVMEVEEGQEEELFWMFLGDNDGYAHASYWKWRKNEKGVADPRIWKIDCAKEKEEVNELMTLPPAEDLQHTILVLHLAYEIFVLVGPNARGRRRDIKLGMSLAQELSAHTARLKPFRPPVHVLILPSQIPLDLRAAVRGLDEESVHEAHVPEHMNLLTLEDAWTHLQQKVWDKKDLADGNMMPLGITP